VTHDRRRGLGLTFITTPYDPHHAVSGLCVAGARSETECHERCVPKGAADKEAQMKTSLLRGLPWVFGLCLLLAGSGAHATDQGITGKKLLLKAGKIVLLSKDASISINGSDPEGGTEDSSVSFNDGSGPVVFSLPATNWSTKPSGLLKYTNVSAPGGPSPVKLAKIKSGLLKVIAKGPFSLPVPNGQATIDVVLTLDGGTNGYCMTFTGTGDGTKFLVKDASVGACALPPCSESDFPTCGGSCPTGQTCQAMSDGYGVTCTEGVISDSCYCVPTTGTCAGHHGLGQCLSVGDTPFTFGPCPPGSRCYTIAFTDLTGEATRHCTP
jgi:hypothetical protein